MYSINYIVFFKCKAIYVEFISFFVSLASLLNFTFFNFRYYLHNLYKTDMNNMSVFRIASLFLENRNNANLKSVMDELLHLIPSYKYVTVLPQLVPHITVKKEDEFGAQITKIVLRCGKEHPHHTLPLLLALVHAGKDKEYCGSTANTDSNENRLQGAKFLLAKMRKDGFHELINNMVTVADSLIELAYCKTIKGKLIDIPRSCKIRKVKNMENVLLPTISLPIRKNANYANIVGIRVFGETYNGLDGINAPKCIKCQGTDGIWRTQLVKGKDDLRQDAVMQQVFNIMNDLLASNKQSNKLLIRTYKVCKVPCLDDFILSYCKFSGGAYLTISYHDILLTAPYCMMFSSFVQKNQ